MGNTDRDHEFEDFALGVLEDVSDGKEPSALVLTDNMRKNEIAAVIQEVGRLPEFGVEFTFSDHGYKEIAAEEIITADDFTSLDRKPCAFRSGKKIVIVVNSDSIPNFYPSQEKFEESRNEFADKIKKVLTNRMSNGGRL